MKVKIGYLFIVFIMLSSCSSETEVFTSKNVNTSSKASRITLHLNENDNKSLVLSDNSGLKSSALEYVSYLEIGDTIIWQLDENATIASIEDIIIVRSECGEENLFEDGVIFNENKTECYGVVSENAFGKTKYDIKYKLIDGRVLIDDPEVDIKPPKNN